MRKKYNIKDISSLTLRNIVIDDSFQEVIEKTNFNFDQILQFTDSQLVDQVVNQTIISIANGDYASIINNSSINEGDTIFIGKPGATGPKGEDGEDGKAGSQIYLINDAIPNYSSLITPDHHEGDIIIDGTSMISKVIKIVDNIGNDKLVYANKFKLSSSVYTALISEQDYFSDGIETNHWLIYDDEQQIIGSNNLIFAVKEDLASKFYRLSVGIDHDIDEITGSVNIVNIPRTRTDSEDLTFAPQLKLKYRRNWTSSLSPYYFFVDYKDEVISSQDLTIKSQRIDLWNSGNSGISYRTFIKEHEQKDNTIYNVARNIRFIGNTNDINDNDYDSFFLIRIDNQPEKDKDTIAPNPEESRKEILLYANQILRIETEGDKSFIIEPKTWHRDDVTFDEKLTAIGDANFNNVTINKNKSFIVNGISTFNDNVTFSQKDSDNIKNITVTVNSILTVNGISTFNAKSFFKQGIYTNNFYADAYVSEDNYSHFYFNSEATFRQNTHFQKQLEVIDVTTLHSTLSVAGISTLSGGIKTNLINSLNERGTVTIGDNANIGLTLTVAGTTTLQNTLTVAGDTTLNSNLSVKKNTSITGTLDVTDLTTLKGNVRFNIVTAITNNTVIVESNLTVNGDFRLKGSLAIDSIKSYTSGRDITVLSKLAIQEGFVVTYGKSLKYGNYDIYHQNNLNLYTVPFIAKSVINENAGRFGWHFRSGDQDLTLNGIINNGVEGITIGDNRFKKFQIDILAANDENLIVNNGSTIQKLMTDRTVNRDYIRKGITISATNGVNGNKKTWAMNGTENIEITSTLLGFEGFTKDGYITNDEKVLGIDGKWHINRPLPDWRSSNNGKHVILTRGTSTSNNPNWGTVETIWNEGGSTQFWKGKGGWENGYLISNTPTNKADDILVGNNTWKPFSELFNKMYNNKPRPTFYGWNGRQWMEGIGIQIKDGNKGWSLTRYDSFICFLSIVGDGSEFTFHIPKEAIPSMGAFSLSGTFFKEWWIQVVDSKSGDKYNRRDRVMINTYTGEVKLDGNHSRSDCYTVVYLCKGMSIM